MRASVANSVITKTQTMQGANQSLKEKLAATNRNREKFETGAKRGNMTQSMRKTRAKQERELTRVLT